MKLNEVLWIVSLGGPYHVNLLKTMMMMMMMMITIIMMLMTQIPEKQTYRE